jgi:hypothetical protein
MLEDSAGKGYDPKVFVRNWKAKLDNVLQEIENGGLKLKHPFYWGPFVIVGYGGKIL